MTDKPHTTGVAWSGETFDDLRAEIVRLDDLADDRLAELERLRAALERITDLHVDETSLCYEIAHEALRKT